MIITCMLLVTINGGGIPFLIETQTIGKVLKEGQSKYLVDFSEGVKTYKLVGVAEDYKSILIDKERCVK